MGLVTASYEEILPLAEASGLFEPGVEVVHPTAAWKLISVVSNLSAFS